MNERPVKLIVAGDLQRNRLTVFFRLLLALPHLIWLALWGVAALVTVIVNWFATLILGTSPRGVHDFLAAYVRYAIHVYAYLGLAANPYPGFFGQMGYPIDVEIAPPQPQNRWTVAFRIVLAIPAALLGAALTSSGARNYGVHYGFGLLAATAFLGWFVAVVRGRMPRGLRDAVAYALAYTAQLDAYMLLLTDRYPNSDPQVAIGELPARAGDPIRLAVNDDLRRSRLTVFFRLLLTLPHLVWLALWAIAAYLVVIVNWFATLIRGTSPRALHRFLAAYVRYQNHVYSYLFLIAEPFPRFSGRPGYPVDPAIEAPRRQNRWTVFFRPLLALPALLIASAYGGLLTTVALLGWFAALATGRMPLGLRNAGALSLRYGAQANGYMLLLTDSYPYSGPTSSDAGMPGAAPASATLAA